MKRKPMSKVRLAINAVAFVLVVGLLVMIGLPLYASYMFLDRRYDDLPQRESTEFNIQSQRITLATSDGLDLAAWRTFADGEFPRDENIDEADEAEDADDEDAPRAPVRAVIPAADASEVEAAAAAQAAAAELPAPKGTVIILSGIQRPSVTEFFGYANMLAEHGWDSLLIELRARGESEGNTIGLAMTEIYDVEAGIDFLASDPRVGNLPIVVLGTSAGGSTALAAGGFGHEHIDGVISISAYCNFTDAYIDHAAEMMPRFIPAASRPFMDWYLALRFGSETTAKTPIAALEYFNDTPLLLMHSTDDYQVPYVHFERLRDVAEAENVPLRTFARDGDWHFVVYNQYLETPAQDTEFAQAIFDYLAQFDGFEREQPEQPEEDAEE